MGRASSHAPRKQLFRSLRFVFTDLRRWNQTEAPPPTEVLKATLALFVYDLREDCSESWGRAVVEAMLTGAVPLVPDHPRHHLRHIVPQGVGGFLCSTNDEWRGHAQGLQTDEAL